MLLNACNLIAFEFLHIIDILYNVGPDNRLLIWKFCSCGVGFRQCPVFLCLCTLCVDGGSVAVASAEVKLFDLSSKKRLRKFPGHPVC